MLCNISRIDGIKKSPTRSDFPPQQLATINSPNLRPRAVINYTTRPLPSVSSSPSSSSPAVGSASMPSSPAMRKSSSSVLGRCKAKIRSVDKPEAIVVSKQEMLDPGVYTPLLPVTASCLPSSPGRSKRQTSTDTTHRSNCALPRMTSSAKTQTGSSLPRAADTETSVRSENSTSGVATADSSRSQPTRPSSLTPAAATAASVQRRRLPSPPRHHDDVDDVERQRGSRRADASVGTEPSPRSTSAAATSPRVTSSRRQSTSRPSH